MIDTAGWIELEKLEFKDEKFNKIEFPRAENRFEGNIEFNTELIFDNCTIECLSAALLILGKKVILKNCKIGSLNFGATYFYGGFELINCRIEGESTFDAGVHNLAPNSFIMKSNVFEGYVDFFDIYFQGPVSIINNNFMKGTNIGVYLHPPYGIAEEIEYIIDKNIGDIRLLKDNDPMHPKKK